MESSSVRSSETNSSIRSVASSSVEESAWRTITQSPFFQIARAKQRCEAKHESRKESGSSSPRSQRSTIAGGSSRGVVSRASVSRFGRGSLVRVVGAGGSIGAGSKGLAQAHRRGDGRRGEAPRQTWKL